MKNCIKTAAAVLLCVIFCFVSLSGCSGEKPPQLTSAEVLHEEEFGGVYICMTIDDFNALGFSYGDSVKIVFSNGYELSDIPYYNGYYTRNGEPLLVAYPGYPYIKAAINNGDDLYTVAGLPENAPEGNDSSARTGVSCTASITLNEHGKYAAIQNARDIHYYDERERYESDEIFANFRVIRAGGLREGILCRSASPCDNQHNRAPYVDALIQNAGVSFILNLSDNDQKIEGYLAQPDFGSPYFLSLYRSGKVDPIALNMNFTSDGFKAKIAAGLSVMAENEGPYLVHCTEGKDRTGFVCMLLEALCGAGYDELVRDYMITYDNYYGISETKEKEKYDVIVESVLNPMIQVLTEGGNGDVKSADLARGAELYLLEGGMTSDQIESLRKRLT